MNDLDPCLLERVMLHLPVKDTVACTLLNKHIHHTMRNSSRIQLKLYKSLYGQSSTPPTPSSTSTSTSVGSHSRPGGKVSADTGTSINTRTRTRTVQLSNPARKLRDLIQGEKNLLQLRPRILSLDIPRGEIVHSIAGDHVFSIYHSTQTQTVAASGSGHISGSGSGPGSGNGSGSGFGPGSTSKCRAKKVDERYFELCTINKIHHNGTNANGRNQYSQRRRLLVNFEPILQTLTIAPEEDLIFVLDVEGYLHSIKMWCRTEIAEEYVAGGIHLPELKTPDGDGDNHGVGQMQIDVLEGGIVVVSHRGLWCKVDWRNGAQLGCFPAEPHPRWESNAGSLISHDGLLVGLDVPRLPWINNNAIRTAALAIFDLSSSNPSSSPDLLLELPFAPMLLANTVRMIANIPKHIKIYPKRNTIPRLHHHQSQQTSFIHISFECALLTQSQPPKTTMLNLVLPLSQIPALRAEHADDKVWVKGRTWRRGVNPFDGITPIPFSAWVLRTQLWVDKTPPYVRADMVEIGYGSRVFGFSQKGLKERGSLILDIRDYEYKDRVMGDVGTEYGALKRVEMELPLGPNERPTKPRNQASNYTMTDHASITHLQNIMQVQGEFKLGIPGRASKCLTDGKKVIIQQASNPKAWVLDFGA
ncbi:hypothetical protein IAT40_006183 [Kwoniella sp. CBS 6097]